MKSRRNFLRRMGGTGLCVVLMLSFASMKVHGWGWADGTFDFWKSRSRAAVASVSAMSEDDLLDAAVASGWAERLTEGRRDEAAALLESRTDGETLSDSARRALDILEWMTSLEPDDPEGGGESVLSIGADDSRLPARLDFWERNRPEIRGAVTKLIGRDVPESLGKRIYHRIDALQTRAYLYLGDIRELKRKIAEAVEADRTDALHPVLEEFRKRHPDVGGIDELRTDLEILEAVRQCVRDGRLDEATRIRDSHEFFIETVARCAARISALDETPDSFQEDTPAPPDAADEAPLLSLRSPKPDTVPPLAPGRVRLSELEIRKPERETPPSPRRSVERGVGR